MSRHAILFLMGVVGCSSDPCTYLFDRDRVLKVLSRPSGYQR